MVEWQCHYQLSEIGGSSCSRKQLHIQNVGELSFTPLTIEPFLVLQIKPTTLIAFGHTIIRSFEVCPAQIRGTKYHKEFR
jgi:hypothetical protein